MFPSLVKPCLSCLFRRIARCNGSVDTLLTADHISSSSWSKYAQPLEKLCSKHSKANVGAPPWSRQWNGHGRTEKWAPTLEVTDRSCEVVERVDARVAQAHDVQELARREPLQGQDLESPVLQPGRGPRRRVRAPVRRRIDAFGDGGPSPTTGSPNAARSGDLSSSAIMRSRRSPSACMVTKLHGASTRGVAFLDPRPARPAVGSRTASHAVHRRRL
mmetsp:Transcript_3080/g.9168  ORF Transcript_3080/g.9168 Transcript_3080/m.9168 type:complete len:217 (-) Transcript_3080:835-1485(-)